VRTTARCDWAGRLKRVFELDLAHCPNCGGELKIIAAILWGEPGKGALRCPAVTVQTTWRPGLLESAASDNLRGQWKRPSDKR
jgi:hypothetical protein